MEDKTAHFSFSNFIFLYFSVSVGIIWHFRLYLYFKKYYFIGDSNINDQCVYIYTHFPECVDNLKYVKFLFFG